MPEPRAPDGVILEFAHIDGVVRVSAMDPHTLTEVVIQGPASAGEAALRHAALAGRRRPHPITESMPKAPHDRLGKDTERAGENPEEKVSGVAPHAPSCTQVR